MTKIKLLMPALLGLGLCNGAVANGLLWQVSLGAASAHFSGATEQIAITTVGNNVVSNQYTVGSDRSLNALFGLGAAYVYNLNQMDLSLGLNAYYLQTNIFGMNSQAFNIGGQFDTLNYSASGQTYALMFEPKFILAAYSWQPYLLLGAGLAINHFGDYEEMPSDPDGTAVAMQAPFGSATVKRFAYEAGLGVQHPLALGSKAPVIALDARYMNFGSAHLGSFNGETLGGGINLGKLSVAALNISLIF